MSKEPQNRNNDNMATVLDVTYDLLRSLDLTTIFGNPGSTEETFLKDFPSDFQYVLALQEASAIAMADGWARVMRRPVLVNLHTAPGVGNAMGNLATAWHNKTPVILTAGQQTREMLLIEPWLTNVEATTLPRPYVKWSYEPARAEDVPGAFMRAYAMAVQPPAGPVFLSLPMDDWNKPALGVVEPRVVTTRLAPDGDGLQRIADALSGARNPLLIMGAGIARGDALAQAVTMAERLRCPVWAAPASEAPGFPEDHPLYQGVLPFAIAPLREKLEGHDIVVVFGAPVFRYYPYVPGGYLPEKTRLFQITDDPAEAARSPIGDAILGDPGLACAALSALVPQSNRTPPARPAQPQAPVAAAPLSADLLFYTLNEARPDNAVLVQESPSNLKALHMRWHVTQPDAYYTMASGGLGYGLPAAVGIALAERRLGRHRPVIAIIGDGSFHYCVQALWTAAQHALKVVVVVPDNTEYAILKSFADQEQTAGIPGLDLPGIDLATIARGYGCATQRAETPAAVKDALREALQRTGPTVVIAPITAEAPPLL